MKDIFKIVLGIIIFIIIGLCIYYFREEPSPIVIENPVVEESILGCYVAKLSKDVYTLSILEENNGVVSGLLAFNNYEKDSSSGTFEGNYQNGILLGNYSFDSEGSHSNMQVIFKKDDNTFVRGYGEVNTEGDKVIFKDLSAITYDANSTFVKDSDCKQKFTEENNKFTFEYNPFFKVYAPNQSQNSPSIDWRINAKAKGLTLAKIYVPKIYMPNTNFGSSSLNIAVSTDPKEILSCSNTTPTNGEVLKGTKNISGYNFTEFYSTDAGAGNFYETTSYRGLLDGDCYVLEYTIHSTNIANYGPEQNIKEFDKIKIQNEFENIIDSFKFLVNSN